MSFRTKLVAKFEQIMGRVVAGRLDDLGNRMSGLGKEIGHQGETFAGKFDNVGGQVDNLSIQIDRLSTHVSHLSEFNRGLGDQLREMDKRVAQQREIIAAALDDIPRLRSELLRARLSEDYERAFSDPEPLVTIRIPTFQRAKLLTERALPSVLNQTYQRFEVIVVGDGCTDDTRDRVEAIGDDRIRFIDLPFRHPYPEDPNLRWFVAGAPGVNYGTELAQGSWLAMLGDDDEMEPHHLESLLEVARTTRSEMVYGNILERRPAPQGDVIHAGYPPRFAEFNFQAAMFMSALRRFEFSTTSWVLGEPSDWNLCRRMLEVGVRIGHLDRVVVTWYPSRMFEPEGPGC